MTGLTNSALTCVPITVAGAAAGGRHCTEPHAHASHQDPGVGRRVPCPGHAASGWCVLVDGLPRSRLAHSKTVIWLSLYPLEQGNANIYSLYADTEKCDMSVVVHTLGECARKACLRRTSDLWQCLRRWVCEGSSVIRERDGALVYILKSRHILTVFLSR
jgi:hypothetical protein